MKRAVNWLTPKKTDQFEKREDTFVKNEKGDITIASISIEKVMWGYYEVLYQYI